jgi:hypothetical protein
MKISKLMKRARGRFVEQKLPALVVTTFTNVRYYFGHILLCHLKSDLDVQQTHVCCSDSRTCWEIASSRPHTAFVRLLMSKSEKDLVKNNLFCA